MAHRRAKAGQILTGLDDVDALLKEMQTVAGNRAARAGLTKACRLGVKLAKQKVPSTMKDAKKALGFSVKMAKGGPQKGLTKAKFGAGVGLPKESNRESRGKKKGVGIGTRNIHWVIEGTEDRQIKKGAKNGGPFPAVGHPTGKMPATPIIHETWSQNRSAIEDTLRQGTIDQIHREWDKLAKK